MAVQPESPAHIERLAREFPFQGYIERTEHRAISWQQVAHVIEYVRAHCESWSGLPVDVLNLYHLATWLIKPATAASKCSFVELLASTPQIPNWFITHWWGERVLHFSRCMQKHMETRSLPSHTLYWICAYANRMHSLSNEIGADPCNSSFYRAMKLSRGVLLILDGQGPATPFARVWCIFEIAIATGHDLRGDGESQFLFDIATCDTKTDEAEVLTEGLTDEEKHLEIEGGAGLGVQEKMRRERSFPAQIFRAGLQLELERATASMEADRVSILNCIAGRELAALSVASHDNYTLINQRVRSIFAIAAWRQACESGTVAEWRLPAVLAADTERTSLSLDFSSCLQMNDDGAGLVAISIPRQVQALDLSFHDCKKITNSAAVALGKNLPQGLNILNLNFMGCKNISSVGVTVLVSRLPISLRTLSLCFYGSQSMGDEALKSLALKLSNQLQDLHLDFEFCRQITDVGLANLSDGLPSSLKSLNLHLRDCCEVGNAGLASLARALPAGLSTLELSFRRSQAVCDLGLRSLAGKIPTSLRVLRLNFRRCDKVTGEGIEALGHSLPPKLEILLLNCHFCKLVGDTAVSVVAENLSSSLRVLVLNFEETQVGERGVKALADKLPTSVHSVQLQVWSNEEALTLATLRSWPIHRQQKTQIPKRSQVKESLRVTGAQNTSRSQPRDQNRAVATEASAIGQTFLSSGSTRASGHVSVASPCIQSDEHGPTAQELAPTSHAISTVRARDGNESEMRNATCTRSLLGAGSVYVICRVRPLSQKEKLQGEVVPLQAVGPNSLELNHDSRQSAFTFDAVLWPGSQEEAFKECRAVIHAVLKGRNSSVIAYGQTGAGKTYTVHGTQHDMGIIYRVAEELFQAIDNDDYRFCRRVVVSALELYRQDLTDLVKLAQDGRSQAGRLQLRISKEGKVLIEGLVEKSCSSVNDLFDVLRLASEARKVMATAMNSESSRSHVIEMIRVDTEDRQTSQRYSGAIHICDLAGAERLTKSQVTGDGAKEAIEINKSLTALGDVCNALQKGSKQIPYRNHKLTMLLQGSLGGDAMTILFINCSPSSSNFDETLMSLKFGIRARCQAENCQSIASNVDGAINLRARCQHQESEVIASQEDIASQADGVIKLRRMGFPALVAYKALQKEEGHLERAVERLLREGQQQLSDEGTHGQPASTQSPESASRAPSATVRRPSRARKGRARSAAGTRRSRASVNALRQV